MNLVTFVRQNRPQWQRLEQLLERLERRQSGRMDRETLRELSHLYRSCTSDLAFAQTYYEGTTLLLFLHQLAGRAHHQIYRSEAFSLRVLWAFFRKDVPEVARGHLPYITASVMIFLCSFMLGMAAIHADERTALLVLPQAILEDIYAGRMWTKNIFSIVPGSVVSAAIFSNNLTVAFMAFVGGITCGTYTLFLLVLNGFMLGVVFKMCAQYGLLPQLLEFLAGHGLLELSAIITAAAGGFVLASALLGPGNHSRRDALNIRGKKALHLAMAAAPALLVAAFVEGFVSPAANIPAWIKIWLGLVLAAAFWFYLLFGGKKTVAVSIFKRIRLRRAPSAA